MRPPTVRRDGDGSVSSTSCLIWPRTGTRERPSRQKLGTQDRSRPHTKKQTRGPRTGLPHANSSLELYRAAEDRDALVRVTETTAHHNHLRRATCWRGGLWLIRGTRTSARFALRKLDPPPRHSRVCTRLAVWRLWRRK